VSATDDNERSELRRHWPLVLAASIGFAFSSIVSVTTGLFMQPLGDEFGWGRTLQASGASITAVLTFLMSPLFGLLIDRWGTRMMALIGIVFAGLIISGFSQATGSPVQWMIMWGVYAFAGVMIKSTVWTAAVSSVFTRDRGLALGLTLSGTAVAQAIMPPITELLISNFGWRNAYIGLGMGGGTIAFIACYFLLFDGYAMAKAEAKRSGPAKGPLLDVPGMNVTEAWKSSIFWRIGLSTFIMMVVTIALNVHQFEILRSAGVDRTSASLYSSVAGIAGILGKLATGWLLDRYHVRWVGGLTLGSAMFAFALLMLPNLSVAIILVAMTINGYSAGTKLQIASYLTSAYGGLRHFGAIFGVIASLIAAGSGLGPVLAGYMYDRFGSYDNFLMIGIAGSLVSAMLIMSLGKYPDWSGKKA
jgi:predicted MFS family arabinose efflux permease